MADHSGLFEPTFEHSPVGIVVTDAYGTVVTVNRAFTLMSGHSASSLVGQTAESLVHPDDTAHEREFAQELATGKRASYQVQKRLKHQSGDMIWTRTTVSRAPSVAGFDQYIAQVEDLTEAHRARDLIRQRSLHDHLTGLPNRTFLLERLASVLELPGARAESVACLYLDIDHLTIVNDSLGHQAGDALLVELARRICDAVRPGDTVARLGGDEFVIIAENIAGLDAAHSLLTVICAAIQAPIDIEGQEVVTTVSAGIAMSRPGITAESLVRDADTAMSYAKQTGRNRIESFSESMRESARIRLSIEAELRTAIREGELVVHYQPVVDLATALPFAYEALVRWDHPNRGLLHPHEFIELCEQANLMVQLGAFVLHEACQFVVDHPEFSGRVFVNVSTRQIGSADLTRVVRAALEATGVNPSRIGLEITESGMLLATQHAQNDLTALTAMGIDLIIDDFGTGYSALSSVLQNPVAGLKLAREFTLRLGDGGAGDRISTAIANLADSLDLYGVIEGIESEAQRRRALEQGWVYGQGYLFSHPAPSHHITIPGKREANVELLADAVAPPTTIGDRTHE